MAYKAGNAFITVAPSFEGFQEKVKAFVKTLPDVNLGLDLDAAKAEAEIEKVTRPRKTKVEVEADTKEAEAEVEKVTRPRKTKVEVEADTKKAKKDIGAFAALVQAQLKGATKSLGKGIDEQVDSINAQIASIHDAHIKAQIDDTEVIQRITELRAELASLSKDDITIEAQFNTAKADEQLAAFQAELERTLHAQIEPEVDEAEVVKADAELDEIAHDRTSTIKVDVDKSIGSRLKGLLGSLGGLFGGGGGSGGAGGLLSSGGVSSGSLFSGIASNAGQAQAIAYALPVVGPALLGGGGALGAGILGSAGLAGVAASLIGNIKQITAAQTALKTATLTAQQASVSYASAQQGVISANEAVTSAVDNLHAAEQAVTTSQVESRLAQDALTDARIAAQRQLIMLTDTLKGAALAESGAKLAVSAALTALQQVEVDPAATRLDVLQAQQSYKEAKLQSDEATKSRKFAVEDGKRTRKEGVSGNDAVISAKQQLRQANQQVATSHHEIAVAQQQVADAQRAQARAQAEEAVAAERLAKANKAVAQANKRAQAGVRA